MTATAKQISYIDSLARRDWWAAQPILQAAYDASDYGQRHGGELTKSSGIKWLGRAIDRETASRLIDDLKAL